MGEREAKKEVIRLTFLNDELVEKNRHFERKFSSLAQRCGASQEDLEAVEVMIGGQNSHEMVSRREKRDRSNSREVRGTG
jgi:hypothetical protein